MSINTYPDLKTAVASWLDRSDLNDKIPDFIALAESRINKLLRVRGITDRATTPMVAGQQYYSLPDDFIAARNVQINTDPLRRLQYRSPEQADIEFPYSATGVPRVYTIIGDEIQLRPAPDSTDTLEIAYFRRLDPLSDSNTTNWVTDNAPGLLLYGALLEAELYLVNDTRVAGWAAKFDQIMADANREDMYARYSGSSLKIMPPAVV